MKNIIKKYQKEAWNAAKYRGIINEDFSSRIFWDILEEIIELEKSLNNPKARLKRFEDIIEKNSDSLFAEYFKSFIKDTKEDEFADIFICCLTFLEECGKENKIEIFDMVEEDNFTRLQKNNKETVILPQNNKSIEYDIKRLVRTAYDTFCFINECDLERLPIKINVFIWSAYLISRDLNIDLDTHIKYKIKYNFLRKN